MARLAANVRFWAAACHSSLRPGGFENPREYLSYYLTKHQWNEQQAMTHINWLQLRGDALPRSLIIFGAKFHGW